MPQQNFVKILKKKQWDIGTFSLCLQGCQMPLKFGAHFSLFLLVDRTNYSHAVHLIYSFKQKNLRLVCSLDRGLKVGNVSVHLCFVPSCWVILGRSLHPCQLSFFVNTEETAECCSHLKFWGAAAGRCCKCNTGLVGLGGGNAWDSCAPLKQGFY